MLWGGHFYLCISSAGAPVNVSTPTDTGELKMPLQDSAARQMFKNNEEKHSKLKARCSPTLHKRTIFLSFFHRQTIVSDLHRLYKHNPAPGMRYNDDATGNAKQRDATCRICHHLVVFLVRIMRKSWEQKGCSQHQLRAGPFTSAAYGSPNGPQTRLLDTRVSGDAKTTIW